MQETTREQIDQAIDKIKTAQSEIKSINIIKYCNQFEETIADLNNCLNTEHGKQLSKEADIALNRELRTNIKLLENDLKVLEGDISISVSTTTKEQIY